MTLATAIAAIEQRLEAGNKRMDEMHKDIKVLLKQDARIARVETNITWLRAMFFVAVTVLGSAIGAVFKWKSN